MPSTTTSTSGPFASVRAWLGLPSKAAPLAERRNTLRLKRPFEAEIHDRGGRVAATGLDFHDQGAMLVSKRPWAKGAVLFVDLKSFHLMGFAEVRHCTSYKRGYAIGFQFCSPLMQHELGRWQFERVGSPSEDVTESLRSDYYVPERWQAWVTDSQLREEPARQNLEVSTLPADHGSH